MKEPAVRRILGELWPVDRYVATAAQLADAGLSARCVADAVRHGLLVRLRRGVYFPMHQWRASAPWIQAKIRLSAHIAGTGGSLVYTHFSAARLHGLEVWNSPD